MIAINRSILKCFEHKIATTSVLFFLTTNAKTNEETKLLKQFKSHDGWEIQIQISRRLGSGSAWRGEENTEIVLCRIHNTYMLAVFVQTRMRRSGVKFAPESAERRSVFQKNLEKRSSAPPLCQFLNQNIICM